MKKRNLQRIFAAFMASAMTLSLAACGNGGEDAQQPSSGSDAGTSSTTNTTPSGDGDSDGDANAMPVYKKADGTIPNLNGMEIVIRDWFTGEPSEPKNEYEEATLAWREYIQKTYNFKITQKSISDWSGAPQDFVDYVTTGGDDNNYAFILRADAAVVSAMNNGLMYNLSTLDCLDFSQPMFVNKVHELYKNAKGSFAMWQGSPEPRCGVFFNNTVLKDAGIDPESIYDMQANGTWTWDEFDKILAKCQRDTNNDGIDDIYGLTINESNMLTVAIFSNGGSYVKLGANGYEQNLTDPKTKQAVEWVIDMFNKYDNHDPEGVDWEYYKQEFQSGKVAAMPEEAWAGNPGSFLDGLDFEVSFVMFPKGPQMTDRYTNVWADNLVAIPACYDKDRAWNIAFAWMLYNSPAPGYEDYVNLSGYRAGVFDERAVTETMPLMMSQGDVNLASIIPNLNLGSEFMYTIGPGAVASEKIDAIKDTWQAYCDAVNNK